MFDMGFIADIRWILRRLPPPEARQSFLFSATLSFRVLELTYEFMNNPAQITVSPEQVTVERVEQLLYHAGRHEKFGLLLGLLAAERGGRSLIFTNTRDEVHRLVERLERNGHAARALSGDVDQRKRLQDARGVQGRERADPRRDRRGVPRAPHPRRDPRLQLGPARRTPRTTSTGSAARPGPARRARRSAWSTRRARSRWRASSGSSASASAWSGPRTRSSCRRSSRRPRSAAARPRPARRAAPDLAAADRARPVRRAGRPAAPSTGPGGPARRRLRSGTGPLRRQSSDAASRPRRRRRRGPRRGNAPGAAAPPPGA